jgi:hypothetical protein
MSKTSKAKNSHPTLERGARSKAVREFLVTNRKASPKVVVAALKEQGIDVSPGLVMVIKYSKRGKRFASVESQASALLLVKKMTEKVGGIGKAHAALDILEQLR